MIAGRRQRGAALIIALVIVAMAGILAAALMWNTHLGIRRAANQLYGAEALANALSVEDFVRALLAEDELQSDHLLEPWAQQGNVFPIEGGSLSGTVVDLQGRLNLNNLIDWNQHLQNPNEQTTPLNQAWAQAYQDLLASLGLDPRIYAATIDWMDVNNRAPGFDGAEDDTYLRNQPAYRAANRPFESVSELRLLAYMTPEQFAVLEPYVTALPVENQPTTVNINTAPPELLVALGLSPEDAALAVELRTQVGFTELDPKVLKSLSSANNTLGVQSSYFLLQALAVIGSSRVTLYSVLHRDSATGVVRTTSRSLGTP